MGLPELDEAAVSSILQHMHVPLKQRLQLALVSKTWDAAAVSSTYDVEVTLKNNKQVQRFQRWLERCAGHGQLRSLTAQYEESKWGPRCFLQVPCSAFQKLLTLDLTML
jgi:hypothetical protein